MEDRRSCTPPAVSSRSNVCLPDLFSAEVPGEYSALSEETADELTVCGRGACGKSMLPNAFFFGQSCRHIDPACDPASLCVKKQQVSFQVSLTALVLTGDKIAGVTGEQHCVSGYDRAGCSGPWHGGFPGNVLLLAPLHGQAGD